MPASNDLEVVTFKVDKSLKKLLAGVSNRSEFIRNAILAAMESACPFCKGTGVLNEHRKKHWDNLVKAYNLQECDEVFLGGCENINKTKSTK